jgi:hypothetical protein
MGCGGIVGQVAHDEECPATRHSESSEESDSIVRPLSGRGFFAALRMTASLVSLWSVLLEARSVAGVSGLSIFPRSRARGAFGVCRVLLK